MPNYEIQKQNDGTYTTIKEGGKQPTSTGDGIRDSMLTAEALIHKHGGGTITVKDENGTVIKTKEVD